MEARLTPFGQLTEIGLGSQDLAVFIIPKTTRADYELVVALFGADNIRPIMFLLYQKAPTIAEALS